MTEELICFCGEQWVKGSYDECPNCKRDIRYIKMTKLDQLKEIEKLILVEDEALYDEIDARVDAHLSTKWEFDKFIATNSDGTRVWKAKPVKGYDDCHLPLFTAELYTRSIDDQAPLMPEEWQLTITGGWEWNGDNYEKVFRAEAYDGGDAKINGVYMTKRPIVELLAIVRVWIWEEENNDKQPICEVCYGPKTIDDNLPCVSCTGFE